MEKDKRFKLALNEVKRVREADERKELEEEMNEAFEYLTDSQKIELARKLWSNMSFSDKKEEYFSGGET